MPPPISSKKFQWGCKHNNFTFLREHTFGSQNTLDNVDYGTLIHSYILPLTVALHWYQLILSIGFPCSLWYIRFTTPKWFVSDLHCCYVHLFWNYLSMLTLMIWPQDSWFHRSFHSFTSNSHSLDSVTCNYCKSSPMCSGLLSLYSL